MQIKFLDLKAQYESIRGEIDSAIAETISSSSFILGPRVSAFEKNFAAYCGCTEAVALNSGTSALHLILKALGVGPGDEVITAANTFIATVASIIYTGARPVLVDIDPRTRNIDLDKLPAAVNPRTKVIMPVHLYGRMVDMERLNSLANKNSLWVVEDACQAHGAKFRGKPAGSYGLAAAFSFYPGKNLGACGEGGAVTTSDKELARKIRILRDHGSERKYYHDTIGYNARMEGLQGAILDVKLRHLDRWNQERNRVASRYRVNLSSLPLGLPSESSDYYQVYHQFVIETDRRDDLQKFLADCGVPTMIHYPVPVHKQKAFVETGLKTGSLPVTERLAERILSLPIYPELTDQQVDYISSKIKEFFGQ
ncbi:MAG: DegT/DnrJ/EryC1/StrS family aminotransferase [bacterium]|jgi:dTDP-4-amino-4,6-dideoxygalactose transaminase